MTGNMLLPIIAWNLLAFEAKANDPGEGIQAFLQYYGHADGYNERAPLTPAEIEEGLRSFQRFFNLPVTGQLDTQTKELIGKERCDMPDIATRTGRFAFANYKWTKSITWVLNWTHPAVPASEAIRIMKESVQEWQAWMTNITVTQSTNINSVIVINYPTSDSAGNHGDPYPFASNTLAHGFYPNPGSLAGDMHYNMDKPFSTSEPPSSTTFSLKLVTVHELGHVLGLAHSSDTTAIMYPYASVGYAYKGLARDDKFGIQTLYGPCTSSPCKNGGTCTHTASNPPYTCTCVGNYGGTNCETVMYCSSGPCMNGGTCSLASTTAGYTCTCPNSHSGNQCQTSVCASAPCQRGGTCQLNPSGRTGYVCLCTGGYGGNMCEIVYHPLTGSKPVSSASWWTLGGTFIISRKLFHV